MPDIKTMLTDLPTSIRLKELGAKQYAHYSWIIVENVTDGIKSDPRIELTSYCETFLSRAKKNMQVVESPKKISCQWYSSFTLSEVIELIDWSKYSIFSDKETFKLFICDFSGNNFEGITLLEAATKALIYQLENE